VDAVVGAVKAAMDVAGAGGPEAAVEVSVGLTRNSAHFFRISSMRNRVEREILEGESMRL
jgi:hypothetical protein